MTPPKSITTESRPSRTGIAPAHRALLLTISLVVVAFIGNTLGIAIFAADWPGSAAMDFMLMALCCCLGPLIAQPFLLAIWLSLGTQQTPLRFMLSISVLVGLTIAYLLAVSTFSGPQPPLQFSIVISLIVLFLFTIATAPLMIFRLRSKTRLVHRSVGGETREALQFGILQMFILTTVVALFIPLVQHAFPHSSASSINAPWGEIAYFVLLFSLLAWIICMLCVATVFSQRRMLFGAILAFTLLTIPIAIVYVLWMVLQPSQSPEPIQCFRATAFASTFAGSLLGVLFLYYAIGYRLSSATGVR